MYVSVLLLSVAFACAARQAPLLRLRDGRRMPALALGTWLGHAYTSQLQPASDEVERAVSWALQAGYRHVDTAARYQVEGQLGRALAAAALPREQLFVTTKLWNDAHAQDAVAPALRASLTRLGLDYVDLYLMHWPVGQFANLTYDYTDYLETWRGMAAAQRQGLARSIGVSNFNQDMMERIREHGLPTPAVLQVEAAPHAPPPRVDDPALVAMATKYNKTVPQVVLRYLVDTQASWFDGNSYTCNDRGASVADPEGCSLDASSDSLESRNMRASCSATTSSSAVSPTQPGSGHDAPATAPTP
ncbi:hypothetical protein MSG28_015245, partial [Choristoneura fumiferana]